MVIITKKMIPKYQHGEISLIITLVSLALMMMGAAVGTYLSQKNTDIRSLAVSYPTCAKIANIKDPSTLSSGQQFWCELTLDSAYPDTSDVACGWSKNGGWPQNGGYWWNDANCTGTKCTFGIQMDQPIDPSATYELVGFDKRTPQCGPQTGMKIPLKVNVVPPSNSPTPTTVQNTQYTCSANCKSQTNGSYNFCYNECTPGRPGYSHPVGCENPTGWKKGADQIDQACGSTPAPPPPGATHTPTPPPNSSTPTTAIGSPPTLTPTPLPPNVTITPTPTVSGPSNTPTPTPIPPPNAPPQLPAATPTPTPTASSPPPPPSQPPATLPLCKPIKQNGDTGKLDVIILPDGFTDVDEFITSAGQVVTSMEKTNLPSQILDKFNYYALTDLSVDYKVSKDKLGFDINIATKQSSRCNGDGHLIITKRYTSADTKGVVGVCYMTKDLSSRKLSGIKSSIVLNETIDAAPHEFGHCIASLLDEYSFGRTANPSDEAPNNNCSGQDTSDANSLCSQWKVTYNNDPDIGCISTCGFSDWYRSIDKSVMDAYYSPANPIFNRPSLDAWNSAMANYP